MQCGDILFVLVLVLSPYGGILSFSTGSPTPISGIFGQAQGRYILLILCSLDPEAYAASGCCKLRIVCQQGIDLFIFVNRKGRRKVDSI